MLELFFEPVALAVGVVYPAYQSYKALETAETTQDDKELLTYWVVWGMFAFVEYFTFWIVSSVPFYYLFKIGFLLWLVSPKTRGSQVVYRSVVLPYLKENEAHIDAGLESGLAYVDEKSRGLAGRGVEYWNQNKGAIYSRGAAAANNAGLTDILPPSTGGGGGGGTGHNE